MGIQGNEAAFMNSHPLPRGAPPDYITIPEHLKSKPVADFKVSVRLRHLLQYAGIQRLGDLDGKRLSEFGEFRGCGKGTLWSLKRMILRELKPRVKADPQTLPIPLHWYRPGLRMEVSAAIRHVRLKDLPVSTKMERVLEGIGIERLGQLHRLPFTALTGRRSIGAKMVAELATLLHRAEEGEFTIKAQELSSKTPADLLRLLDDLVSQLPERLRTDLAAYLGATNEHPKTVCEISLQHGVTESCVRQELSRAIRWMRRLGSLRLLALLDCAEGVCMRSHAPLSPVLVSTWQDPARPCQYRPQFYVRLIRMLRAAAGLPPVTPGRPTCSTGNSA
jgi:hypothetical protein